MMGDIQQIRAKIESRLRTLEAERAALENALRALSDVHGAPSNPPYPSSRRARRGENLAKILPLVTANPDLRPKEIAEATGVDARVVSATLSKLRRQGRLPATD